MPKKIKIDKEADKKLKLLGAFQFFPLSREGHVQVTNLVIFIKDIKTKSLEELRKSMAYMFRSHGRSFPQVAEKIAKEIENYKV